MLACNLQLADGSGWCFCFAETVNSMLDACSASVMLLPDI